MADRSKIEWCDATWNPITGCSPVSEGCANCYAARTVMRFPRLHGADNCNQGCCYPHPRPFGKINFHPDRLDAPRHWKKPRRIFVCSMGDLFHEDVPMDWVIENVLPVIDSNRRHTFMFLTKRPKRMRAVMEHYYRNDCEAIGYAVPSENLWLGVTAENQAWADERIPILLQTPAAKRFVSVEPMLGPMGLCALLSHCPEHDFPAGFCVGPCPSRREIDWVILGGETGAGARALHPHWAENLRDQCVESGVPFFFKGWGTKIMKKTDPGYMKIDGREWKEAPG